MGLMGGEMKRLYFLILISIVIIFTTSYSSYVPNFENQLNDIYIDESVVSFEEPETVIADLQQPDNQGYADNFNSKDILRYIREQCFIVGINYNFAISLLREENPMFFNLHENLASQELVFENRKRNSNGSISYGLWQLNGNNLWVNFIPKFWHNVSEFDWKDPYHNTYVAVRYINWLHVSLQKHHIDTMTPQNVNTIYWETAMAYFEGLERVLGNSMSAVALDYAVKVIERIF